LPTSTVAPFGISVRTGLFVPGDFRKFVSPVVTIGLAAAQTTDSSMKIAADAAARLKFMGGYSLC
jgi:hypothetical protein